MTEVLFYHLEQGRLEDVLPGLLEKCLERQWRVLVRCGSPEKAEALDAYLWVYHDESFLPHSLNDHTEGSPIVLSDGPVEALDSFDVLFLVDDAEISPEAISSLKRSIVIFNGHDETALARARNFWKAVVGADYAATYWRQNQDGRWEKQS